MIEAISALTSAVRGPGSVNGTSAITDRLSTTAVSGVAQTDFAGVLADVSNSAIGTLKTGEAMAITGIQGKSSVQEVVSALLSAEETLQTALAVRDKVVAAYQDISHMTI